MFLHLLLFLQISKVILTSSATLLPQSKPGCETKCGNLTIPYPFGIGPRENGCSFIGDGVQRYNITCDASFNPPKALLVVGRTLSTGKFNMIELISIADTEVRVKQAPATICFEYKTGKATFNESTEFLGLKYTPFTISSTKNKLFGVGCYNMGYLFYPETKSSTDCFTKCVTRESIIDGSCSGNGCCQVSLPKGLKYVFTMTDSMDTSVESISFNPCTYTFIGETDNYTFSASDITGTNMRANGREIPIVFDWAVGNKTCEEAQKDMSTFTCQKNSNCFNSDKVPGYLCACNTGFAGNPYLGTGCEDVNECENQDNAPCEGVCTNTIGSYHCTCPKGYAGDGRKGGIGCIRKHKEFPILKVSLGVGLGFLFLIIASSLAYLSIKRRKLNELKEKFFQQNGGLLLKQRLSSYDGGVEATKIFTAEELKAATKNYSDELILGTGGFGTVYLGTLSDKSVVAVKKSKVIDESQIEQFINELVILSRVNHRNVVKVLGCCLETEVPVLVYEYISNGTLFQHIHNKVLNGNSSSSLSWNIRLRIATESAGALSYLHSAASIPIIHRDMKSANILLDENYTAKVSDFGASRLNTLGQTQIDTLVQGTLGYLDPEYFHTSLLTDKSDVYSFGVVLVELLTGEKPLSLSRSQEQRSLASFFLYAMEESDFLKLVEPQVANEASREHVNAVAELAKKCLNLEGEKRPTMKQVAAELENLCKSEAQPFRNHNQLNQEQKSKELDNEPRDLYAVPISSYNTSGDSGQYSIMEKGVIKPMNLPR